MLGHELRNPLAPIRNCLDVLGTQGARTRPGPARPWAPSTARSPTSPGWWTTCSTSRGSRSGKILLRNRAGRPGRAGARHGRGPPRRAARRGGPRPGGGAARPAAVGERRSHAPLPGRGQRAAQRRQVHGRAAARVRVAVRRDAGKAPRPCSPCEDTGDRHRAGGAGAALRAVQPGRRSLDRSRGGLGLGLALVTRARRARTAARVEAPQRRERARGRSSCCGCRWPPRGGRRAAGRARAPTQGRLTPSAS